MEEAQGKKPGLSDAERTARILMYGMQLDATIIDFERAYSSNADAREAALFADPESSPFTDVLTTGQHYLSPLDGNDRRHWRTFIVVAKHTIKKSRRLEEHTNEVERINSILYDTLGGLITRVRYPHAAPNTPVE